MHIHLRNHGGLEVMMTFVYANNSMEGRNELWKTMMELGSIANGFCWIVQGDFNGVRTLEDRQGQDVYNHDPMVDHVNLSKPLIRPR